MTSTFQVKVQGGYGANWIVVLKVCTRNHTLVNCAVDMTIQHLFLEFDIFLILFEILGQ